MLSFIRAAVVVGTITSCAGCGGNATYPVTGKVTHQGGKPLAGVLVEFQTEAAGQIITARGHTGEDGSYALETPERGVGAVPGQYKVILSPPSDPPGGGPPLPQAIDKTYQSYKTTPLMFEVKPGGPLVYDIEVTGRKRK
jgi:hypothetical protein